MEHTCEGSIPVLQLRGITKRFPGTIALNNVNFSVLAGEIHALVGENGAGKSTLTRVLTGMKPDTGIIHVNGQPVSIPDYRTAQRLGISLVPQEMALAPALSIAENILMGQLPQAKVRGIVDFRRLQAAATRLVEPLGMQHHVKTRLGEISLANQQLVAIAKALAANPNIIIMDEPTSALTQREKRRLFTVVKSLKERGISVIYISHIMEEIFLLADRITVLRDGECVGTVNKHDTSEADIIRMMVGRELGTLYPKESCGAKRAVLEVRNLCTRSKLDSVSFTLHAGEILGIGGLLGSGRSELLRVLFGADRKESGEVLIDGNRVDITCPTDAISHGIALVPEDRKAQGLHLRMNIRENICMVRSFRQTLGKMGFADIGAETCASKDYVSTLSIKLASLTQSANSLSGGNQQKVVLAKWLTTSPNILLLDEPTRGIDVGAKAAIHGLMNDLARQGMAIIMASSELPELLRMADRILVMANGRAVGVVDREDASQEVLMRMMTGGKPDDSQYNRGECTETA